LDALKQLASLTGQPCIALEPDELRKPEVVLIASDAPAGFLFERFSAQAKCWFRVFGDVMVFSSEDSGRLQERSVAFRNRLSSIKKHCEKGDPLAKLLMSPVTVRMEGRPVEQVLEGFGTLLKSPGLVVVDPKLRGLKDWSADLEAVPLAVALEVIALQIGAVWEEKDGKVILKPAP
jgi:hypothetical protein